MSTGSVYGREENEVLVFLQEAIQVAEGREIHTLALRKCALGFVKVQDTEEETKAKHDDSLWVCKRHEETRFQEVEVLSVSCQPECNLIVKVEGREREMRAWN